MIINMRLEKLTKQLYWCAYVIYIKLYACYFSNEYLHVVYIISLKVILYVG